MSNMQGKKFAESYLVFTAVGPPVTLWATDFDDVLSEIRESAEKEDNPDLQISVEDVIGIMRIDFGGTEK